MTTITTSDDLKKSQENDFWILYYDFPWADCSANYSSFKFWVSRKYLFLKDDISFPIYSTTEGNEDVDEWIMREMKKNSINHMGSGWGAILICKHDDIVNSEPMIINSGLDKFTEKIIEEYKKSHA